MWNERPTLAESRPETTDLLEAVADLTESRDKDALEAALAAVVHDLLDVSRLTLWRVVLQANAVALRPTATLPAARPAPAAANDAPALDDRPELLACRESNLPVRWSGSGLASCCYAFPVSDARGVLCILEIERAAPLMREEERLVQGLLRVYRNHVGLLDHSDCDALTGLLNRRTFDDVFRKLLARDLVVETSETPAIVVERRRLPLPDPQAHLAVIDIDRFKRINDIFGHPYGDEVLVILARLMSANFRETDYLFRFGGEEFVVILPDTAAHDARTALEKLRHVVETHNFPQVGRVTVSIGFTAMRLDDLGTCAFGRADQALYYAKRHGRNQLHSYEDLSQHGRIAKRASSREIEVF